MTCIIIQETSCYIQHCNICFNFMPDQPDKSYLPTGRRPPPICQPTIMIMTISLVAKGCGTKNAILPSKRKSIKIRISFNILYKNVLSLLTIYVLSTKHNFKNLFICHLSFPLLLNMLFYEIYFPSNRQLCLSMCFNCVGI